MKYTKKLDQLTALRFVAAMMIVVHHCGWLFGVKPSINLDQGVSFFFVLSGFILAYVYPALEDRSQVRRFWLARFARVWPIYALGFVAAFALDPYPWNTLTAAANLTGVQAWLPMSNFYFSYNGVSWSISTEAFFYLVFPFLIRDWASTWWIKLGAAAALALAMYAVTKGLALPYYGQPYTPEGWTATLHGTMYINPLSRLFEFVTGMAVAHLWRNWQPTHSRAFWTAAEVLALLASVWSMHFFTHFSGNVGWYFGPAAAEWVGHSGSLIAFAVLVFVMAQGGGAVSSILMRRPMVLAGEISFAMYLLHQELLGVWRAHELPQGLTGLALFTVALLAISYAAWRLLEVPARAAILRLAAPRIPGQAVRA